MSDHVPPTVLRPPAGRWPQPFWRIALAAVILISLASLQTKLQQQPFVYRLQQAGASSEDVLRWRATAVSLMQQAMAFVSQEAQRRGIPIDAKADPTRSGLIGAEWSLITTTVGHLPAKRTTLNPAWAGLVVDLLVAAGVQAGDTVAAGISGSFPALNLAVFAAAEAMGLRLKAVSSLGASQWGANIPEWTWLDMESALYHAGYISQRSVAFTAGGEGDLGPNLIPGAMDAIQEAARRNGVDLLSLSGLGDSVTRRLQVHGLLSTATSHRPKAYINVGGNEASLGRCEAMAHLASGLSWPHQVPPCTKGPWEIPGVVSHMAAAGIPIIHLLNVRDMAFRYGLPLDPLLPNP